MILDYEVEQYRQMILEERWEDLAEVMDRKLQRCILAMSAQVIEFADLHAEVQRICQEVLDEVLDPRGGSLGYTYDYTPEAWEQVQREMGAWRSRTGALLPNGAGPCADGMDRFFRAMEICHIPVSLLAVMPEDLVQPLPASAGFAWVNGGEEMTAALAAGGFFGTIPGENGVEAQLQITGPACRGSHPSAGAYTSYEAMGYVTGYTAPQPRPLTVELYDAYPEDIMVRYQPMPMDEYAYRRHWETYFRWKESLEGRIRSEIDRELGRVSGSMQSGAFDKRPGGYDERSYGGF